jgi:hypothetical protein
MTYLISLLSFSQPTTAADLVPLVTVPPPAYLLGLPNELLLQVLRHLLASESVLLGLTCRRLYVLHRSINPFLIDLGLFCPNPRACRCLSYNELNYYTQHGTPSVFIPHWQHRIDIVNAGGVGIVNMNGTARFLGEDGNADEREKNKRELGCYEVPGATLAESLKEWMGDEWEFCYICGWFRRIRSRRVDWSFKVSLYICQS